MMPPTFNINLLSSAEPQRREWSLTASYEDVPKSMSNMDKKRCQVGDIQRKRGSVQVSQGGPWPLDSRNHHIGNIQMRSCPHCHFPLFPPSLDEKLELAVLWGMRKGTGSPGLREQRGPVPPREGRWRMARSHFQNLSGQQLAGAWVTTNTDRWRR